MSKKPRNKKKYDPIKNAARSSLALLRNQNICAVRLLSDIDEAQKKGKKGNTILQNFVNGRIVATTPALARGIITFEYAWSITLFYLCRNEFGKEYIKDINIKLSKCKESIIAESVSDMLDDFEKQNNRNHILNKGWIAIPYDHILTKRQTERILKRGFDYQALWEKKQEDENEFKTTHTA